MLGVLKSLRDTIIRFALASVPLSQNAVVGTKILKVPFSRKFFEGETIVIRNATYGEIKVIDKIVDEVTISITENLEQTWNVSDGSIVEKAPGGQYVKRIYLGDPDAIPDFPAITIVADNRDEEWWTINSTTAKWNCTISCVFEDDGMENSYENMLLLTKSVESSLWANRWPIFGILAQTSVTQDVNGQIGATPGDTIIHVASTSGIQPGNSFVMEDFSGTQSGQVTRIVDSTHLEILQPAIFDFKVSRNATFIIPSRWVMWTKPGGTTYGFIHKGALLKASQINWFAQEEIVRYNFYTGPAKL